MHTLMLCKAEGNAQALDGDVELSSKATTCPCMGCGQLSASFSNPKGHTAHPRPVPRNPFISYDAALLACTLPEYPIGCIVNITDQALCTDVSKHTCIIRHVIPLNLVFAGRNSTSPYLGTFVDLS